VCTALVARVVFVAVDVAAVARSRVVEAETLTAGLLGVARGGRPLSWIAILREILLAIVPVVT
jgi:hypothetical protein